MKESQKRPDPIERVCPRKGCGKTFTSRGKTGRPRKYCSPECAGDVWANQIQMRKDSLKTGPVEKTCATCGDKFKARSPQFKYCSRKCRVAGLARSLTAAR